jgi:serine/threonine protein phosphatase PrpC
LRHPVHRGSVLAAGLLLDTRLLGQTGARARILGLAEAGCEVYRLEAFLAVVFRVGRRVDCKQAQGAPLLQYEKVLSAAELDQDERKAIDCTEASVLLVEGGIGRIVPLNKQARQDTSEWIDLGGFEVQEADFSFGIVVAVPETKWIAKSEDVRAPLGVPPISKEAATMIAALTARKEKKTPEVLRPMGAASVLAAVAFGAISLLGGIFGGLFGRGAQGPATGAPGPVERSLAIIPNTQGPMNSWLESALGVLRHGAARFLMWSRLAGMIGRRQAQYLERMMDMFESNDLDNALRHAIPLSDAMSALGNLPPSLGIPTPRKSLGISTAQGLTSSAIGLSGGFYELLRQKYRRAFERLVELGEIEKAAFVLGELLNSSEEAVSFLERHDRLLLAAEIAEAKKLPAPLVIRQWFLAKNKERAIQIARRTGAFAAAVTLLEKTHKDQGKQLRLLWANELAEAGAFAAAVDAAMPIEPARGLVVEWMDRAIAVGGRTAARMRVRKLRLKPESFGEIREQIRASFLEDDGQDAIDAVAQELLNGETSGECRVLAKVTARAMLRFPRNAEADRRLNRLAIEAKDTVLWADYSTCKGKSDSVGRKQSPIHVQAHACTDKGSTRYNNEDDCIAAFLTGALANGNATGVSGPIEATGLLLGAFDGMGGLTSGAFASGLAKRVVFEDLQRDFPIHGKKLETWQLCVGAALEHANSEIFKESQVNPSRRGTGSAATIASICEGTLVVAHVGDSRCYLLRDGKLKQVTTDDTLIQEYISAGKLTTEEEIRDFPHKNVITKALGMSEDVKPRRFRVPLCQGDTILLCSDGLTSMITDGQIQARMTGKSPEATCKDLVEAVYAAGARDNLTVVIAKIEGKTPSSPTSIAVDTLGAAGQPTMKIWRKAADAGALAVKDAALLPNGRMIVALGEIGAWLLSKEGKILTRFSEPADRLVISDHGDRAILVAARGQVCRLAKLDLVGKRIRSWCDAEIERFAESFDGSLWYVSRGNTVFAIDALSDDWEHIWSVSEGAIATGINRDTKSLSLCFENERSTELWSYEAASHTLRKRRKLEESQGITKKLSPSGLLLEWRIAKEVKRAVVALYKNETWQEFAAISPEDGVKEIRLDIADGWLGYQKTSAEGLLLHVCDTTNLKETVELRLDGIDEKQEPAQVRFQDENLIVSDERGRVLVISMETGKVIREHRLS